MFDFIRKPLLWRALDRSLHREIGSTGSFHLKTIQDLAVHSFLRECKGLKIAEIGGSVSRLLPALAKNNVCVNVEKFEGANGGATAEIHIPGVENIKAFLGEFDSRLAAASFDAVFSISVVEHVPDLAGFFDDGMRILKPGGLWLHAVDIYLENEPDDFYRSKFEALRGWAADPRVTPTGLVYEGPPKFTCDMASNPDRTMYNWGLGRASRLTPLRQRAQCVSLLIGARKK